MGLFAFILILLFSPSPSLAIDPAFAALRSRADHGDVKAQFKLGQIYEQGLGVASDPLEATRWYRMAAEQGHSEAASALKAIAEKKQRVEGWDNSPPALDKGR
jgi:TPR repeat protein